MYTLSELKQYTTDQLAQHWLDGNYPFDIIGSCDNCLTMHAGEGTCHLELRRALYHLNPSVATLSVLLPELYAIRQQFQHLYTSEPEQLEQVTRESRELVAV
jgi:hypothetical protein